MLIGVLILFFIILLLHQVFLANSLLVEGLENESAEGSTDTSPCSSSVLVFKNAADIKGLQQQINTLNQQVTALVTQQSQAATQLVGDKPLSTSGLSSAP
jgi:hypothetical protein